MSRQIQIRRGTATQHNNFTGAIGEVTMDTTNKTLRVHDGSTLGGNEIMSVNKFWSYATNCVVEISQDIQVSYSGTTLTIKKDSKLYYPNGTGVFDNVVLSADETCSARSESGTYFVFRRQVGTGYFSELVPYIKSGTPDSSTHGLFYDTSNNRIDWYEHGTKVDRLYSFPICKITVSGGAIVSIDQVFNGFGYIGSTVFALPGVAGLIADGRNADGTLKSTYFKTTSVLTGTPSNGTRCLTIRQNVLDFPLSANVSYDSDTNYVLNGGIRYPSVIFDITTIYSGTLSSFNPKTAFHAVDYNDTDFIAHQAMPSSKYTDLTLPATGGTVTAPGDGYFYIYKGATANNEYITMYNSTTGFGVDEFVPNGMNARLFLPASKGDVITFTYTLSGTTNTFRFIYANGAK